MASYIINIVCNQIFIRSCYAVLICRHEIFEPGKKERREDQKTKQKCRRRGNGRCRRRVKSCRRTIVIFKSVEIRVTVDDSLVLTRINCTRPCLYPGKSTACELQREQYEEESVQRDNTTDADTGVCTTSLLP